MTWTTDLKISKLFGLKVKTICSLTEVCYLFSLSAPPNWTLEYFLLNLYESLTCCFLSMTSFYLTLVTRIRSQHLHVLFSPSPALQLIILDFFHPILTSHSHTMGMSKLLVSMYLIFCGYLVLDCCDVLVIDNNDIFNIALEYKRSGQ